MNASKPSTIIDWSLSRSGFVLRSVHRHRQWYHFLSNGEYGLKISHLGDGYAMTLSEPRIAVTHYDFYAPVKGRFVYIIDGSDIWNITNHPVPVQSDSYECLFRPGHCRFSASKNGIQATHSLFLPRSGTFEINKLLLKNDNDSIKTVSCVFLAEPLLYDSHNVDPVYYSWFTNTYERDGVLMYEKVHGDSVSGFVMSNPHPDSFETSLIDFCGNGTIGNPEALKNNRLSCKPSGGDPYIAALRFSFILQPGEEKKIDVFLGVGQNTVEKIKESWLDFDFTEAKEQEVVEYWQSRCNSGHFEFLEGGSFADYCRTFLPYQIFQQSEGLVRSVYRGFRDVAQDAMGIAYYDPSAAERIILDMCRNQHSSGKCLRQWNTSGSLHDQRDFRDLGFWFAPAIHSYLINGGNSDFFTKPVSFLDGSRGTVNDHITRAMRYYFDFRADNLLKTGEGDWNDALSGFGTEGGSVWLNQFALYCIHLLEESSAKSGIELQTGDLREIKPRLTEGVLANWNGQWFNRGLTADNVTIGERERIFLLPQAWFVISGLSAEYPELADKALNSMMKHLEHEYGLLLCNPGFERFDSNVGNLSALAPGVAENFAVYNHATAFGVYSLFMAGRIDDANRILKKMLPFTKDPLVTKSEPYVLVNYYNGGYYEQKKGRGGIPWLTSTVSWLARILAEFGNDVDV